MGDIFLITKLLVINMFFTEIPYEECKPNEDARRKRSHKRRRKIKRPVKGLR